MRLLSALACSKSIDGADQWGEINPMEEGGANHVIKIDPKNPARIFAGGYESGVWLSSDRGISWKLAGLEGLTIPDLVIEPSKS